jgi:AI-2 transport protein TqsA
MPETQPLRFLSLLLGLASVFIIIWGIQNSAFIINPILLATVITITVLPLPAKFAKRGLPGWLSLLLTILVVVGTLLIVILLVVFSVSKVSADISTSSTPDASSETASTSDPSQSTSEMITNEIDQIMQSQQWSQITTKILAWAGQAVFLTFMVLLIFIFMLAAAISLPSASRMGLSADSPVIARISQVTNDVRRYMLLMTGINLLVGIGDMIFLWIMGIPYALLWGILAWVLGYIPSIGFWLALVPPVFIAYSQYGAQTALIVFLGYVLINGSVQNIIQPKIFGQGLRISPVIVFISLFVWGWLLGGVGAILAVPITLMILSLLESFDVTRWLVVLIRATPEESPGEKEAALDRAKGMLAKARLGFRPAKPPEAMNQDSGPHE